MIWIAARTAGAGAARAAGAAATMMATAMAMKKFLIQIQWTT